MKKMRTDHSELIQQMRREWIEKWHIDHDAKVSILRKDPRQLVTIRLMLECGLRNRPLPDSIENDLLSERIIDLTALISEVEGGPPMPVPAQFGDPNFRSESLIIPIVLGEDGIHQLLCGTRPQWMIDRWNVLTNTKEKSP